MSLHDLCIYLLNNNLLEIYRTNIGVDNLEIFDIKIRQLYTQSKFQTFYIDSINTVFKTTFSEYIYTFSNKYSLVLNSILSYSANLELCILKDKIPCKKNIDNELDAFNKNILIPLLNYPESEETMTRILNWILFLIKYIKPKRICLAIYFDIHYFNKFKDLFIKKFNEIETQTTLYIKTIVTQHLLITNLENNIDTQIYENIKLFYSKENEQIKLEAGSLFYNQLPNNNLIKYYKSIIEQKKTKLCISLESIDNQEELVKYCNLLGPYIAAIKINSNFLFNINLLIGLNKLAKHHKFIIIDDKRMTIDNIDTLANLNSLYMHCDAITIHIDFVNKEIETKLNSFLTINSNASILLVYMDNYEEIKQQKDHYSKYVFGVSNYNKITKDMVSLIDYSLVKQDFSLMKASDMIILGKELYQEANPIEIVSKINTICFK